MPKYVIERNIPGAGAMNDGEWQGASAKSNEALAEVAQGIKWIHSYVTADKLYCVYEAPDADIIRKHGEVGGFPTDEINEVVRMIDPSTGG